MSGELLDRLREAILKGDTHAAADLGLEVTDDLSSLDRAVKEAISTIRLVGDKFGSGEIFLPEMVVSAEAMQAFMEIAEPHMTPNGESGRLNGTVLMATVKGDIHAIGKDIVVTMMRAAGLEVIDLGVDVSPMEIIKTAEKSNVDIIGLSALMTTSLPYQKEVINLLTELDQRDDFWVIIGGGPVTEEYARGVGANGWAANAAGAVRISESLLKTETKPSSSNFHSYGEIK